MTSTSLGARNAWIPNEVMSKRRRTSKRCRPSSVAPGAISGAGSSSSSAAWT
jgi:hypothetical protein